MKSKLYFRLMLLISACAFTNSTHAQSGQNYVEKKLLNKRGLPSLIIFNNNANYRASDAQKVFNEQLGAESNSSFKKIHSETDNLGIQSDKFQLYHKGVKVEFSTYTLHSKSGKVNSMSGEFYSIKSTNTQPTISSDKAFALAIQEIGAKSYLWENEKEASAMNYSKPEGELVLLPVSNSIRLAYKFDIYATNPISRGYIYIDAVNGKMLHYNAIIKHVNEFVFKTESKSTSQIISSSADTRYSGNRAIGTTLSGSSYILSDNSRGNGVLTLNLKTSTNYSSAVNFTDNDNNWTSAEFNNAAKDNGALDAHWGAEMTYDYWKNIHGRNSFDNAGATIKSYVHYSSNYNNAFWNGSVMTYGDGSGAGGFDILTSLDVAGHEIGHAVCSSTANLNYQAESGALNEALSDIWGACIENYAAPNKQIWLVGEDIERRNGHIALRSMSNPKQEGQPDTYGGTYWYTYKGKPNSMNDYGGVHTNSGVLNHWFYILTEGKIGTNDIGSSYNVTGIGISKAAQITYRMERIYMSANSNYADARNYGIQAATDIFGANSPEVIATTNAFYAVGVGSAYIGPVIDNEAPSTPTNLVASNTTQTSTDLSWDASSDNVAVTGYDVYMGTTNIGSSSSITFHVTGLDVNTEYTFSVFAKDAAGNISSESNVVTVTTLDVDNEAPSAPTNLIATNTTQTSTDLSWDTSTDNVSVSGYDVYMGASKIGSANNTNYTVNGLTASTNYTFSVFAKDTSGNVSSESNIVNVTTLDPVTPTAYCESIGGSGPNNNIENVNFNTINNTSSGITGYEDFTSVSTNVIAGNNYSINITPFKKSNKTKEGFAVFIDFNGDFDFDDAGETVLIVNPTSSSIVSGNITIPSSAVTGSTKMRVSMKANGIPTACEIFTNGQVEDYTVNINPSSAVFAKQVLQASERTFDFVIYPNPATEMITVTLPINIDSVYKIYNSLGSEMLNGSTRNGEINIGNLSKGIYFLNLTNGEDTFIKSFIKN